MRTVLRPLRRVYHRPRRRPRIVFRRRRRRSVRRVLAWWLVVSCALLGWSLRPREEAPGGADPVVAVWNARAAALFEFPLEQYVTGVVAAEMPASFHPEALKAQAVAARTYALRRVERDDRLPEYAGAHLSSDFQVHQAWIDEAQFVAARPGTGEELWRRIEAATAATRGLVLTYGGELAETLYHSTSGGHTEDAARYFAGGQPYLQAMPDPFGDHSPVYESRTVLSKDAVFRSLGVEPGSDGPGVVAVLSRTEAGRADEVLVGDRVFTGRHVREALGLRSSWFDVTVDGGDVVFDVRGNGHGVGMSQYGADGMGRAGYGFEQILAYYYPGTVLERRY